MYRGCTDSGGCHRCRLDGSGTASAGRSSKSGAAGFADPTCPAARPTVGRARNGPPPPSAPGCRGAQSAGARHQRRGRRGHRVSAAGDRAARRRRGRAGGATAADRRGAPGDRCSATAPTAMCSPPSRRTSTTMAGCALSSPRAASPASGSMAISARPATRCCASSTGSPRSSRSIRSRWSATCCWRRTCRVSACAPCWSRRPINPARSTWSPRSAGRRFPASHPSTTAPSTRPGRSSSSACWTSTASASSARRPKSPITTPSRTARISARPQPRCSSAPPA